MPPALNVLNTWTCLAGVTHGVDEQDTGYLDPVYDWVPWCGIVRWVPSNEVVTSKRAVTCIACMKEMP